MRPSAWLAWAEDGAATVGGYAPALSVSRFYPPVQAVLDSANSLLSHSTFERTADSTGESGYLNLCSCLNEFSQGRYVFVC